jgi:hypothetical protein
MSRRFWRATVDAEALPACDTFYVSITMNKAHNYNVLAAGL